MDKLERMTKGKIPGTETGIEVRKSICAICDPVTQCGLDCYVKDGRVIKVEGTLENPQNAGTLCAKGAAQRQWVYHEDRLRTPLKRVGPRGSGQMVPISWTEALDTIAEKLQSIKAESGPESVVFYCGYPKHPRPFLQRLAMLYGSPNYCTESSACATAAGMAWRSIYGQGAAPDLANTKCVFALGRNPFHAGTTQSRHLLDARERGVKFIVADPRVTPLASMADIHLQLRPGTDGALALAMANFIISEGLHDREFVSRLDPGLRRVPALRGRVHPGAGRGDNRRPGGEDPRRRPPLRDEQAGGDDAELLPGGPPRERRAVRAGHTHAGRPDRQLRHPRRERRRVPRVGCTCPAPDSPPGSTSSSCRGRGASCLLASDRPASRYGPRWWTNASRWTSPARWRPGEPYPLRGLVAFGLNYRLWPDSEGFLAAHRQAGLRRGRRPLPHRQRQARRHRPSHLLLPGTERAALLSAEVRRLHDSGHRAAG